MIIETDSGETLSTHRAPFKSAAKRKHAPKSRTKSYRVTWEIDIEATSPKAAAKKALQYQRDPDSSATYFDVRDPKGKFSKFDLDLDDLDKGGR